MRIIIYVVTKKTRQYFWIKRSWTMRYRTSSLMNTLTSRWAVATYASVRVIKFPGCFSIKYWTDTAAPIVCIQMCLLDKHFLVFRKTGLARNKCPLSSNPDFLFSIEFHLATKRCTLINVSYSFSLSFSDRTLQHREYYYIGIWNPRDFYACLFGNNGMRQQRVISNKRASM